MSLYAWFEKLLGRPAHRPARPRHRRLELETLETRLTPFALSGNAWIHPELITIGFVPDGTVVGGNGQGAIVSNLQSSFNAKFGSAATWQNQILKAAQQWAQQTNINFTVITDSGGEFGSGLYQQGDPLMADVRIGGYNFGNTTLALAHQPAPINNTSYAGDLLFNTGQTWNVGSTYDLFTVATHEIGHSLGLEHSAVSTASLFTTYNGIKPSLTTDDVNGIRAVTGWDDGILSSPGYQGARLPDSYDAAASNGTSATASNITSSISSLLKVAQLNDLNVTSTGDVDFYKFTVPVGLGGTLSIKAQSSGLSLLAPSLTVYNSAMTSLGTVSGSGYLGSTLTTSITATAGQTYYVRVSGAISPTPTAFGTGNYALSLGFAGTSAPVVIPPLTLTLNSDIISGGGGQAARPVLDALEPDPTIQRQLERSLSGNDFDAGRWGSTLWARFGQSSRGEASAPQPGGNGFAPSRLTVAAPFFEALGASRLTIAAPSLAGAARAAAGVVSDGLFASLVSDPLNAAASHPFAGRH